MGRGSWEGGQGTPGAGRLAQPQSALGWSFARHVGGYWQGLLHQALTASSRRFLFLAYIKARTTA